MLPSPTALLALRERVQAHVGTQATMTHMMGAPATSPEDFILSLARGEVKNTGLRTKYAETGRMAEVAWRS